MKRTMLFITLLVLVLAPACSAPGTPKFETRTLSTNEEITFSKLATSASAISEVVVSTKNGVTVSFDGKLTEGFQVSTTEYSLLTGLKIQLVDNNQKIQLTFDPQLWEVK